MLIDKVIVCERTIDVNILMIFLFYWRRKKLTAEDAERRKSWRRGVFSFSRYKNLCDLRALCGEKIRPQRETPPIFAVFRLAAPGVVQFLIGY